MDKNELEALQQRGLQANPEAQQKAEQQRRENEERRSHILVQILTPSARERLSRIAMVKGDKARQVEDMIIGAAQSGRLAEKVDDAKLVSLLEQISEKTTKTNIIVSIPLESNKANH
ncbi:hypothetical protein SAMD00019534_014620 [Acytostelium subglobosum LB1]|uniref:hypothetical protein n=1 Tax=Acytostelium subglobosum LB1 TaxID=1410327 RepID=UPI0006450C2D|nr:hypothetical protein SAMD00019534_014620 [Acytostelium subglobosum LB1]GAM18287.1 hypothetical protein SAMD00019534_014620 [Acytostelium subglobosum LB1]|eukprot:XP_012758883.1 hypothetical protein SAMD00019534_014620 [Acytostelium subglobosum LB1]